MTVGESMWELAVREGVTEDNIVYYGSPALFFTASESPGNSKLAGDNVAAAVNSYVQFRETVTELRQEIKKKYDDYLSATKKWRSKGKLADKIVAECHVLFPALPTIGDAILSPEPRREREDKKAKESYMLGMSKPCRRAPDSLSDEYNTLTTDVAEKFKDIDRYVILSALSTLHEDDRAFISSADTILHRVLFEMKTNRYSGSRLALLNMNTNISLKNKDLFAARRGETEQIYALKNSNKSDGSYEIYRVDHHINRYTYYDLFDRNDLKLLNAIDGRIVNLTPGSREKITCKIEVADQIAAGGNMTQLIDHLSGVHRNKLYNSLYESGNDLAEIEKIWHTVKHFIPFYDCIDGSINHDAALAVPSCLTDIIAFLPVIGEAVSLSARFGMVAAREALFAGRTGVVAVGKNALRGASASMPTTAELASLGNGALKAADPGFQLLAAAARRGRDFAKRVAALLSGSKKTPVLAQKMASEGWLARLPQATSGELIKGKLPGTDLAVPIKAVDRLHDGRNVYVRVNPETGMPGVQKFICKKNGVLEPLHAKVEKIRNIREVWTESNRADNDITYTGGRAKRGAGASTLCSARSPSPDIELSSVIMKKRSRDECKKILQHWEDSKIRS